MPCGDGGVPYPPTREEILEAKTPRMLCAVLSTLDPGVLDACLGHVNWKEAGVTRAELEEWWALHRKRDAQRRKREKAEADQKELRGKALAKLTPAEAKALRLKK